jgi:NAD(P)-dependent dehydrogenase (short-subunit alcohol dehydrogenase family)
VSARQLEDKVCVVTGGGGGIGRATALEMAARGAKVVVGDIDATGGEETIAEIAAAGGEATFVQVDVLRSDDIARFVDCAAAAYGRIDVLHNNAGVHETGFTDTASVEELPEEIWDMVVGINLKAVWLTAKHAAPHIRRAGGGAIVNVSSTGGLAGYPMGAAYCASKGGVIQLTKVMAIEWARDNIRVNCYCPTAVDTPMIARYLEAAEDRAAIERALVGSHLIKRLGRPEEIARLVCFLASDESSFVTGAAYLIDGGSLAWRGVD